MGNLGFMICRFRATLEGLVFEGLACEGPSHSFQFEG